MEEIFGYVESIVFAEEENGFVVAKIKEPKKQELTLIIGILPGLHVGESVRCLGNWKRHQKFGLQFEVKSFASEAPTDLIGIQRYLESGMIKGIGPAYAGKIVKKFGLETLNVIDSKPEKLLTVNGIGEKRIETIIRCWEEQRLVRRVMIFLRGHGISPSFAQKIFKAYGEESIEKIQENPYRIAQEIRGIGFKSADQIAQNLGIEKHAPQRISSGIQYVLWELSGEGHVCYPKELLVTTGCKILEVEELLVQKQIDVLVREETLIEKNEKIWLKPLFLAEMRIAKELIRLKSALCALRQVDIQKALAWVEEKLRIQLAIEQKRAISSALDEKLLIITGGPGTGKSTITNALLRICEKLTKKILLAAPTGRAAKRMSEITHRRAFTIHCLLEMSFASGGFKKNQDNPLKCDLIIIDEASMIDTYLMNSLLKAIPNNARVIFVGDVDQLPSVGPGNVLRDMIVSEAIPVIRLTEIFRQAKGSDIVRNAHKINQGEFPWLQGKRDFRFIEEEKPEEIQKILIQLITKELPEFHKRDQIQVLCPMKKGIIGTENLNQLIQNSLNPSDQPLIRMGRHFHKNDKVMQIRNNYQKEIFNGDIGVITEIDPIDQTVNVVFDGKGVCYEFSELDELVLAYAVSIHKYQGSECPCIILPVHTSHFKLLYRNLLYTGITRGKKRVILVGTKKAIAIAVRNSEGSNRYSGLKEQLQSSFKVQVIPFIKNKDA